MQSITIGDTNTWQDLGLALANEDGQPIETNPPEFEGTYVELLGGGLLDLSDAYGEAAYGKREQTFEFLMKSRTKEGIEAEATKLMGLFHGQRFDYSLSWDEGYTYSGRWKVDSYANRGHFGTVSLSVVADPWKSAGSVTYVLEAASGGMSIPVENGRRRVRPVIEVPGTSIVAYGGQTWTLEAGTWTIDGLVLEPGESTITIDTAPELGDRLVSYWEGYFVGDLLGMTVKELSDPTGEAGGDAYVSFERFYL